MEYKVIQDTRYQDRYEIWAISLAGTSHKVAIVNKSQVQNKLKQLTYPYGV